MGHRYSNDVKHIKILNRDGCFHIAENNKFGSILVSLFPFFNALNAFHTEITHS